MLTTWKEVLKNGMREEKDISGISNTIVRISIIISYVSVICFRRLSI